MSSGNNIQHAPDDQASRLRRLVEQSQRQNSNQNSNRHSVGAALDAMTIPSRYKAPSAPVVAVASGKGGVGKTNLCVNLAIILSQQGLRVTLVDADLGMANADVLCGLMPQRRLERAVTARDRLPELAINAPGGFRLVPGSVGVAQLGELPRHDRDLILSGLADLDASSDLILVDTAAGAGSSVLSFLHAADLAIVVTTPEPTAITDAYSLIKCLVQGHAALGSISGVRTNTDLGQPTGDVRIVVNQAINNAEAEAVYQRIEAVCARFLGVELGFLGSLCVDRAVPEAVRARHPFTLGKPDCNASLSVARIAAQITQALELNANVSLQRPRGLRAALSSWLTRNASDGSAVTLSALR